MSDMVILMAELTANLIQEDDTLRGKYEGKGADPDDMFWYFNDDPRNLTEGLRDLNDHDAIQEYMDDNKWREEEKDVFWYYWEEAHA